MTFRDGQVRRTRGSGAGTRNLVRSNERLEPGGTGGCAIGGFVRGGRPVRTAAHVKGRRRARGQDYASASSAARSVVVGRSASIRRPGVCSDSAARIGRKASEPAELCHHHHAAAGTPTSPTVVERRNAGAAIRADGPRASNGAGPHSDEPSPIASAARVRYSR